MVSSGADVHESSLKTPHFGVGERQMAKMVTCPPSTSLISWNPRPPGQANCGSPTVGGHCPPKVA